MRILVVGDGKVGHTIAEHLAREEHDVVIVDTSEEALQRSEETLDVMCVRGNGANATTLLEAGADKADILIAATASDETNMLCCLISKKLGAKYAIARVRDPEFNESLSMLKKELDIDMAINPERATAIEISRLLRFPFASNIESFAKGRVEMVEFRAHENDVIIGKPLKDLGHKLHGIPQVLYVAVERDGDVVIPNGDFVIEDGDRVHVAADVVTITSYFRYLGKHSLRVKNVLILGGGRISYYLAKMIVPTGTHVSIIEINERKAASLSEQLPDVNVIYGDGTDQELLEQEGLSGMDAFVALCDRDEENLMTGLFAASEGVPKVIVKNNRVAYAQLISSMGLESIVSPKAITCANILRYVRAHVNGVGTKVEKIYRLMDGKAEALEFIARAQDPYIGIALKDLTMRKNTLVAVIVRAGKVIIPFGNDHIEGGDSVVIMARESGIGDLNEVIRK
ncbi:MAG: Trk system potassium transporter TrkA [Clostridiales bacterium]|nr:Trk system potassium transporter TrkA [Clostridiales bacterium]